MTALARRSLEPELMDAADFGDAALHARCLADLASVNRWTLAHRPVLRWLRRTWRRLPPALPVSVLDVGSGEGDLLRAIRTLARAEGRPVRLRGIDLHPNATAAARAATPAALDIRYDTGDVFHADLGHPDCIVSSQVAHHFDDAGLLRLLRRIDAEARLGWCIADLHRHWLPHAAFPWIARAMRWHRVVRVDGTRSIERAFTRADWQRLLAGAGVAGAAVGWHVPFRMSVGRVTDAAHPARPAGTTGGA